jgi:hypothetical protein
MIRRNLFFGLLVSVVSHPIAPTKCESLANSILGPPELIVFRVISGGRPKMKSISVIVLALAALSAYTQAQSPNAVINWSDVIAISRTTTTCQVELPLDLFITIKQ